MKSEKPEATIGKGDSTVYTILLERFPTWSDKVSPLLEQDEDFAELCADYEELTEWLATHCDDNVRPESECAANRLLLAELEIEILHFLQAVDRQPGHQA